MEIEFGKLSVLLTIVICATVLAAIHVIDSTTWFGLVSAVGGYVYGNGKLAAKGKASVPMIGAKATAPTADVTTPVYNAATDTWWSNGQMVEAPK